jgi:hypothetical protein
MEREYCFISRNWWNCLDVYEKEGMVLELLLINILIELVD